MLKAALLKRARSGGIYLLRWETQTFWGWEFRVLGFGVPLNVRGLGIWVGFKRFDRGLGRVSQDFGSAA